MKSDRVLILVRAAPIYFILLLCGACGRMIPGRVYAVPEGRVIDFKIETSYGHGLLTGFDSAAAESFTGEYSAFYKGQETLYGNVGQNSINMLKPPTGANAFGILIGDKGTTIRLFFESKPGFRPSGFGRGTDQAGVNYEAYF